eukprot:scaffold10201_cov75-Phaeocystis_antarctica.AAC.1
MRPLQQRLRRRSADSADGCRQHEANAAEQSLRHSRRHVTRELAPRQLAQDIRHAFRRGGEKNHAARRSELEVAVDAELYLTRRAMLALLRLEAQTHSVMKQVEALLSRAFGRC